MVAVFNVADPTVSEPVTLPFAVGVNTTAALQLAPAARLAPQVFCVKPNGAVAASISPVAVMLLVLLIVAVCAALAWLSVASVNAICAGLTFNPEPLNATVTAFTPSVEDVTASAAALAPAAAGVKITCNVQLLPLLSVAPHVVAPVEKLFAP
jgi:hypothetical protein